MVIKLKISSHSGLVDEGRFYFASRTIMLGGDLKTEMVEYELSFLTTVEVDVLIAQVGLSSVNAFALGILCEYRHKSYISKN